MIPIEYGIYLPRTQFGFKEVHRHTFITYHAKHIHDKTTGA